jgi:hypothetical protein
MFVSFFEIMFSGYLLYRWSNGLFVNDSLAETNYMFSSIWIAFTSVYSLLFSVTIVALVGSQAKRYSEINPS